MARAIMQVRSQERHNLDPPPDLPRATTIPIQGRDKGPPPPPLLLTKRTQGNDSESSEDEAGESSAFKRVFHATLNLRSAFQDLRGKMRVKSEHLAETLKLSRGNQGDMEKGANAAEHGALGSSTGIDPRKGSPAGPAANADVQKHSFDGRKANLDRDKIIGLDKKNFSPDGKKIKLDESTENTQASVRADEEKQVVENIDGKNLKEHAAVDLQDEKISARGAQSKAAEMFQTQKPASETDQRQKASEKESQSPVNQAALIPETPKDPQSSALVDAGLRASDLNQIASAAPGKDQQDNNGSSATNPINTSAKGEAKLTDSTPVNAVRAGSTSMETGTASRPGVTFRPRKARTSLRDLDERLIKGYLLPTNYGETPPLQLRRTLDQYFYTHLESTSHRDSDQVIYRYMKKHGLAPKMFMVDQLWLWILNNGILFLFPARSCRSD
jgi:hypothetical protein